MMKSVLFHLLNTFGWLVERICSIGSGLFLVAFLVSLGVEDMLTTFTKATFLVVAVLLAAFYFYYSKLLHWLAPN